MINQTSEQIPNHWRETSLGDIAAINPAESLRKGVTAKYVAMENLDPFTRQISKFELKEYNGGMKFRNGDTLLARITPCLENGKTAYVDFLEDNEIAFGSTEYIVIREKPDLSDRKFLYYLSISPRFREIAIKAMSGTSGRQRVQTDLVINRKQYFPPVFEQRAIAAVLSSFDDKIELLHTQNKSLENIAQSFFKHWFINFEFPDKDGKPYRSSGGEMIDSEIGEIPQKWRVGRLADEFQIIMGQSPEGESYNEDGNGMIFFQGRTDFQDRFPKIRLYTSHPKRIAEKLDILVSVRAPVGDINVACDKCCIGRGLAAVRSKYKSYALCKIKSLKDTFDKFEAEGTIFGAINKNDFENILTVLPEDETIKSFEKIVSPLDKKYYNNFIQIQTLSQIRDIILPKLMKGELRVKGTT